MNHTAAPLEVLIDELKRLPGFGDKSATRLAYQLMNMPSDQTDRLIQAIRGVHTKLNRCRQCQNYTEGEVCPICGDPKRDRSIICVVETPRDVQAIERTREYRGLYHVLYGLISPVKGIGPDHLTIRELVNRLADPAVKEVIMGLPPTVEGDATSIYLARTLRPIGVRTTRLATGVPVGSKLEQADRQTIFRALEGRRELRRSGAGFR